MCDTSYAQQRKRWLHNRPDGFYTHAQLIEPFIQEILNYYRSHSDLQWNVSEYQLKYFIYDFLFQTSLEIS